MFLRAARSMTAFAAMCDGGSPEDGFTAASRDGITANALAVLHECQYNTGKALQMLLKCPYPASADVMRILWPEDDVKDFIKGLRTYGKNFFKIRTEFLPERETPELVEFYYFWKKTPGAANNRPRGRRHRPNVLRRIKPGKTGAVAAGIAGNGIVGKEKEFKTKRDADDPSSMSEPEESDVNGENGEPSPYYCRHCFTTDSKDWHHAGQNCFSFFLLSFVQFVSVCLFKLFFLHSVRKYLESRKISMSFQVFRKTDRYGNTPKFFRQ
jgi:arginine-glutamic acid dipeptide repeat-containing protein